MATLANFISTFFGSLLGSILGISAAFLIIAALFVIFLKDKISGLISGLIPSAPS